MRLLRSRPDRVGEDSVQADLPRGDVVSDGALHKWGAQKKAPPPIREQGRRFKFAVSFRIYARKQLNKFQTFQKNLRR
ncbi:hypothetical protein GCM10011309_14180 [Litorimonas cladophorae]|uniref:Uncharacterized protein n=1 Tax=Litorimonas cladophorae TaxID=1220491 RepID=A0A918NGE2_9PROT|nr:hypothetical protein GCM10011309_14180 [Litorimonas cladophorae]